MTDLVTSDLTKTPASGHSNTVLAVLAVIVAQELDRAADRLSGAKPLIQSARAKAVAAQQAEAAGAACASGAPQSSISQTATVALRESAVSDSSALLKRGVRRVLGRRIRSC